MLAVIIQHFVLLIILLSEELKAHQRKNRNKGNGSNNSTVKASVTIFYVVQDQEFPKR